jgi:DNA mismatch repair protein MutL
VEPFGKNSFVIQGTPAGIPQGSEGQDIEKLLEAFKHFNPGIVCTGREKLVRAMASRQSIKTGVFLSEQEMRNIINDLSACRQPNVTVGGNPTYIEFGRDYLEKLFSRT